MLRYLEESNQSLSEAVDSLPKYISIPEIYNIIDNVSINEPLVNIFPLPFRDKLFIEIKSPYEDDLVISLYNINGTLIEKQIIPITLQLLARSL